MERENGNERGVCGSKYWRLLCNRQRRYGKSPKINEPMEGNMLNVPPMTDSLLSGIKFSTRFTIASLNSNACNRILVVSGAFMRYPVTSGILSRIFFFYRCVSLLFLFCFSCHLSAVFPAGEIKKTWPERQRDPETSARNSQLHAAGRTGCLSKW